jgi:hypothetical protein
MDHRRGRRIWLLGAALLLLAACGGALPASHSSDDESDEPAMPVAATSVGLVPAKGDRILTITSDDPGVAITGVFVDGKPLKTAGLGKASVRALLAADPQQGDGAPCDSRGMELRLANGVIYRPQVDFCATHDLIRAAARLSRPSAALPPPPEDFAWQTEGRGGDKILYFGPPEIEAAAMLMTCHQGTTRARLIVLADAGARLRIDFYAPDRVLRYDLRRAADDSEQAAPRNMIELSIADQLFALLQQRRPIAYRIGAGEPRMIGTAAGADQIDGFVQWCQGA